MSRQKIRSLAESIGNDTIQLRHFLHSRPETAWKEVETSKKVETLLREWGYENIHRGFNETEAGVTADLNIGKEGPSIALRADMDALAIMEENNVPYASQNPGVMHACGHDAHMSILLGAARVLASIRDELPGRVRVIFQPSEESGIVSGANCMIKEGALEGIDAIAALHIWSPLETGVVAVRPGPIMASADSWTVRIFGKGGHGAMPQDAVDPTLAATTFINSLQTIVSREIDPQEIGVVSVGKIIAGSAFNIIPDSVEITGSVRTFNPAIKKHMPEMIKRIADGISAAYRCRAELDFTSFVPVTINDEKLTDAFIQSARKTVGDDRVCTSPLVMVSEDFSYYQEQIPGLFFFLGSGNAGKGTDHPHHSPHFNVDDDVLVEGVALLAGFALDYLAGK
ncbi:MAG: amidohydrolase [Thermovirgaceae bacterium]|nr:amidohydrolase [Thermovirgaceae bacterium]